MIVPIFILLLGVAGMAAGFSAAAKSYRARQFPTVKGRVVSREIGPNTTARGGGTGRLVEPRVRYTYSVGGREHVGTRIGLAQEAYDPASAQRALAAIPDEVEVHYNPEAPDEAYLSPSSIGLAVVMFLIGAAAFVGGSLSLLLSRAP